VDIRNRVLAIQTPLRSAQLAYFAAHGCRIDSGTRQGHGGNGTVFSEFELQQIGIILDPE
jgi:hypothetical protein